MPIATVSYSLSTDGQKAAIIAGLSGEKDRKVEVEATPELMPYLSINSDGTLYCYIPYKWDEQVESVLESASDVVAVFSARAASESARKAEENQKNSDKRESLIARTVSRIADLEFTVNSGDPDKLIFDYGWSAQSTGSVSDPMCSVSCSQAVADAYRAALPKITEMCEGQVRNKRINEAREAILKLLPDLQSNESAGRTGGLVQVSTSCPHGDKEHAWAKQLVSVDPKQGDGRAFEGPWLSKDYATVDPGAILVVGSKTFEGSRKRGDWVKFRYLYIATPIGRIKATGNTPADALKLLEMDPFDRIGLAFEVRMVALKADLSRVEAVDASAFEDLEEMRLGQIKAIHTEIALIERLVGLGDEPAISDITQAALQIIRAGYRALAKIHHPDQGGSDATMALLIQAQSELRVIVERIISAEAAN